MIDRYVSGVLDTGTIPTLKHFVANNTDFHRRTSNSVVDERTLHEIYLPAFKAGIDAGAMAVMTSYNQLNGEWCGESSTVINDLLRKQLGFKWLVMTDWWSVWDAEKVIKSGQDLEMPGEKFIKADAARLLQQGKVTQAQIDRMAMSIIRTSIAMGLYDRPVKDTYFLGHFPAHEAVALQAGREAVVLLKNAGNILPLRKDGTQKILLTGKFVEQLARGGGAADVAGYDIVTLQAALQQTYGSRLEYVKTPTDEQLKGADVVLFSTGTRDNEGWDRPFAMPEADEKAVTRAVTLNPRTVVLVNSGGGIQMTGWNAQAAAIVHAWYPGQSGNKALAEILCGEVNPSGKLPITIEKRFQDSPASRGYLPEGATLYSGWGPDNDMSQPIHNVRYDEGVFVGYRWYETKAIEPMYAFGHGLSYTSFSYKDLTAELSRACRREQAEHRVHVDEHRQGGGSGGRPALRGSHRAERRAPDEGAEGVRQGHARARQEPGGSDSADTARFRLLGREEPWLEGRGGCLPHSRGRCLQQHAPRSQGDAQLKHAAADLESVAAVRSLRQLGKGAIALTPAASFVPNGERRQPVDGQVRPSFAEAAASGCLRWRATDVHADPCWEAPERRSVTSKRHRRKWQGHRAHPGVLSRMRPTGHGAQAERCGWRKGPGLRGRWYEHTRGRSRGGHRRRAGRSPDN